MVSRLIAFKEQGSCKFKSTIWKCDTLMYHYCFLDCCVGYCSITDIPGRPNSKNETCSGKCLEETNQSLNDRG